MNRYVPRICAIAALLAGCDGTASQGLPAAARQAARSWSDPAAKAHDLLYVSDLGANDVDVYPYPSGKLAGTLTGFGSVAGLCTAKDGDVFVVDEAGPVDVYAHGGSAPIRRLTTAGAPYGCAVDPVTGNLALTNLSPYEYGTIAIYAKAQGKPKTYFDDRVDTTFFCTYDAKGNLFVDGWDRSAKFILLELAKGGKSFKLYYPNDAVKDPSGVQWDGKYVVIGDKDAGAVYRTTESGQIAQTVDLKNGANIEAFWIDGSTLIGPIAHSPGNVAFWHYPAGGTATKTLGGFTYPFGATVSSVKP
jgi:hypothetical protein